MKDDYTPKNHVSIYQISSYLRFFYFFQVTGFCWVTAVSELRLTCLSDSFVPFLQEKAWRPLFPNLFLNSSAKQHSPRLMLSPPLSCPFETQLRPRFYFNRQSSRAHSFCLPTLPYSYPFLLPPL